jgi:hypothetical protein
MSTGSAIIARTLTHRVAIVSPDAAMQAGLAYLACDPTVDGPPPSESRIAVVPAGRHWRIVEDGEPDKETLGLEDTLAHLHGRLFDLSLTDRPKAPILHAASLVRHGRRILLVGQKGTGKTTLTLLLATRGFVLESDENLFVTPAGIAARPRGCRIKEASLPLLGPLATAIERSPFIVDYRGARIFNFDPRTAGIAWHVAEGPADAVILLRPNHGGLSSLREIPVMAAVRGLMGEVALQSGDRMTGPASLARLASTARRYDMSLGEVEPAIQLVEAVAGEAA